MPAPLILIQPANPDGDRVDPGWDDSHFVAHHRPMTHASRVDTSSSLGAGTEPLIGAAPQYSVTSV